MYGRLHGKDLLELPLPAASTLVSGPAQMNPWRVLSPDSPTRPRPEKHLSRLTGLRGGRGGPVRRHPRAVHSATPLSARLRRSRHELREKRR